MLTILQIIDAIRNAKLESGWAGVKATHTGDYLDCPATGRPLEFNGLDFWKLENDMYVENWVFVDMIHLFRQFGIDLFERIPRH